ncbi:helix-turn-helix transcriptional regulator [Tepidimonas charontis]|uniref:Helix-turn-helix domain protein n=1 Tax=Tepidimonas charontis TaxID=2267262 RepID=A0A554X8K3_9BURK|nr:helix-turn-helix domain-containing protein [Tepidimonas charontis]TSE32106.1 Helix-turn-helix domain protein [Tepidimonas charontis]
MSMSAPQVRLLRAPEVARALGIGRSTLYRWVAAGLVPPPLRLGGAARWRPEDIERVLVRAEALRKGGGL